VAKLQNKNTLWQNYKIKTHCGKMQNFLMLKQVAQYDSWCLASCGYK